MVDNSDRIKEKLRNDSEDQAFSIYLNSKNPVFVIDRKGNFTNINDAFSEKIGIPKDKILGTNIGDVSFLTKASQKEARLRHVTRLLGKQTPVYSLDVIDKDGDISTMQIDTKPQIKQGKVVGEVGIVRKLSRNEDLSARINTQTQKQKMKETHI